MTKPKATTPNPKALPVAKDPSQTTEQALARAALNPSINSAAVMGAYQGNLMGDNLDMGELVTGLLYLDPVATDLHLSLNTSDTPLNALGVAQLCPGAKALEKINASLR